MGRKYASTLVKVSRNYGERDELNEFLSLCNREGYKIKQALDVGNGWFVFLYTMREDHKRGPKDIEK